MWNTRLRPCEIGRRSRQATFSLLARELHTCCIADQGIRVPSGRISSRLSRILDQYAQDLSAQSISLRFALTTRNGAP